MTCSSWPKTKGWGCQNGEDWTFLDESMGISQTVECESLCHQQNSNGCCYLSDIGCFWKNSAEIEEIGDNIGLAVTCSLDVSGILFTN